MANGGTKCKFCGNMLRDGDLDNEIGTGKNPKTTSDAISFKKAKVSTKSKVPINSKIKKAVKLKKSLMF